MTEQPEPGELEQGVLEDLAQLPLKMQRGGLAKLLLFTARQLDQKLLTELSDRDANAYAAQYRHCLVQLREWAPGEVQDDPTDVARKNREDRMQKLHAVPDK